MAEKREITRIITPAFVAVLAYLNTPSQYGRYTVIGKFDPKVPEVRKFLSQLKKLHTAAVEKARAEFKPTKKIKAITINDAYTQDEEGGTYSVTMSEKAEIEWVKNGEKKKASLKPAMVDSNGQQCDVEVWGGSTLKAAIDVSSYCTPKGECGIRLALKGVQIIDLKTRGKRDLGFGAVDGGFDASDFMANAASAASAPATDSDDEGDDEFLSDDAAGDETDPLGTDESGSAEAGESTGDDYDF